MEPISSGVKIYVKLPADSEIEEIALGGWI